MKKSNTSPLGGMQELLPRLQIEFDRCRHDIEEAFLQHGFQRIETPTIERLSILLAKAGGETEKQIYKVVKTAECQDDADQALRFDHTVPLARYVVEHLNDLAFPFRVTQVGRNFRGERPQKGRFREFYQCDIDIIGRNRLSVEYDAEVILTLAEALRRLPLPGDFRIRVSNRKLLTGLLEALNLEQHASAIFRIIDHAEKVSVEKTREALEELKIGSERVTKIVDFMNLCGDWRSMVAQLRGFNLENAGFREGVRELERVLQTLEVWTQAQNATYEVVADMKIVRGLDYYTGTVFETILLDHPEVGSICSGGRYESLASNYTEQKLPGVGGSIGLSRLFYILRNFGSVTESMKMPVDYCLIPLDETRSVMATAAELAQKLRRNKHVVDVVWGQKKLGDKMKYAGKVAERAVIIGEEEVRLADQGGFKVKNLISGEEEILMV